MYVQMADHVNRVMFETIHKVDTINKATRLWEEYFPNKEEKINIVIADKSYDYVVNDEVIASLMKVGTEPNDYERIYSAS